LQGLRRLFRRFLQFLGLELACNASGQPANLRVCKLRGPSVFESRVPVCWAYNCGEGNHNWRRISRVLECLQLFGLEPELAALHTQLFDLWVHGHLPKSAHKAVQLWQKLSGFGDEPLPAHGSRQGLALWKAKLLELVACVGKRR